MDIQAEKIELIKLIASTNSEEVLAEIREIFSSKLALNKSKKKTGFSSVMEERIVESRKQIANGEGVSVSLDDIWK